jgi:hypothetical protein
MLEVPAANRAFPSRNCAKAAAGVIAAWESFVCTGTEAVALPADFSAGFASSDFAD